jgi:hypothetical protein
MSPFLEKSELDSLVDEEARRAKEHVELTTAFQREAGEFMKKIESDFISRCASTFEGLVGMLDALPVASDETRLVRPGILKLVEADAAKVVLEGSKLEASEYPGLKLAFKQSGQASKSIKSFVSPAHASLLKGRDTSYAKFMELWLTSESELSKRASDEAKTASVNSAVWALMLKDLLENNSTNN